MEIPQWQSKLSEQSDIKLTTSPTDSNGHQNEQTVIYNDIKYNVNYTTDGLYIVIIEIGKKLHH